MEVLYIYNPQIEPVMTPDEKELHQLFMSVTVAIPGVSSGRAIGYEAFKAAIEIMMNKASKVGELEGFEKAESIVHQVLTTS